MLEDIAEAFWEIIIRLSSLLRTFHRKWWAFNPERDIEYRCGQLFYKFKSDTLFLYSNEAQTKESINGIPIVNESFETKRKILTVDNCSENGYNYILASPREETGEQNYQ